MPLIVVKNLASLSKNPGGCDNLYHPRHPWLHVPNSFHLCHLRHCAETTQTFGFWIEGQDVMGRTIFPWCNHNLMELWRRKGSGRWREHASQSAGHAMATRHRGLQQQQEAVTAQQRHDSDARLQLDKTSNPFNNSCRVGRSTALGECSLTCEQH